MPLYTIPYMPQAHSILYRLWGSFCPDESATPRKAGSWRSLAIRRRGPTAATTAGRRRGSTAPGTATTAGARLHRRGPAVPQPAVVAAPYGLLPARRRCRPVPRPLPAWWRRRRAPTGPAGGPTGGGSVAGPGPVEAPSPGPDRLRLRLWVPTGLLTCPNGTDACGRSLHPLTCPYGIDACRLSHHPLPCPYGTDGMTESGPLRPKMGMQAARRVV